MASSEGNYHRRGPYFDGTNFASWKHKMKMHILGHNPVVLAVVHIGLQGVTSQFSIGMLYIGHHMNVIFYLHFGCDPRNLKQLKDTRRELEIS